MRRPNLGVSTAILSAVLLVVLTAPGCAGPGSEGPATARRPHPPRLRTAFEPAILKVQLVRELPHRSSSYTQGLLIHDGLVFESRGQFGTSGLDVWDPETGEIVRSLELDEDLFGEGLVRVGDSLWQLTWQAGTALRWRLHDLSSLQQASYPGQGWGLEYDGKRLIMSDGTHELRFFDPESFEPLGKMSVWRGTSPQDQINELEYVAETNTLFANIYETDEIVRIDLATGNVTGIAQVPQLLSPTESRTAEVLNGIALWPERDSFVITGKHWPKSFEVRFVEEVPEPLLPD